MTVDAKSKQLLFVNGLNQKTANIMKNEKNIILYLVVLSISLLSFDANSMVIRTESAQEDTVSQKNNGLIFFPIIFYTPETKMAGGAAFSYYYRKPGAKLTVRPSTITPIFVYTQNKQIITFLSSDLYWKDETYNFLGDIGYSKFPDNFYGIGNNTSIENEENYTAGITTLKFVLRKKIRKGFYLGGKYEGSHNKILEIENDGFLSSETVLGYNGGVTSGIGVSINYDTRDNIFYTSKGSFYSLSVTSFSDLVGSDYSFLKYGFDFRHYFLFAKKHIFAAQANLNIIDGDPPFTSLSLFGGENMMRGYYSGRYRDKNMAVLQMEYRSPIKWRFGFVGFAGFGDVANKFDDFDISNFKYSVGWGIRYVFDPKEKINLRLDFGYGEGSSGVYINIGEAF
jgi:hypothetical protein